MTVTHGSDSDSDIGRKGQAETPHRALGKDCADSVVVTTERKDLGLGPHVPHLHQGAQKGGPKRGGQALARSCSKLVPQHEVHAPQVHHSSWSNNASTKPCYTDTSALAVFMYALYTRVRYEAAPPLTRHTLSLPPVMRRSKVGCRVRQ